MNTDDMRQHFEPDGYPKRIDESRTAGEGCAVANGSPPSAYALWCDELRARRVAINDEWQAAEDWLDARNDQEAIYFIERTIAELRKLQLHMRAYNATDPSVINLANTEVSNPARNKST